MPSADVLEFASLLAPFPGEQPAGSDLRTDHSPSSLYYAVKDARNAARAAERRALMEGEDPSVQSDWRPVIQHATKALAERSKDLEIAAYLIEALVRRYGFAGLRDGFRLVRGFCEQFWDGLFPMPDEEGLDTRVAPLTGLNGDDAEGTLIAPITQAPLTEGGSLGPFAYFHYQQAAALGQIVDEEAREGRIRLGAVTLQLFEKAVAESSTEFLTNLVDDLRQCQDEFAQLCLLLEEKCGSRAPPSSNIRTALAACLETILAVAKHRLMSRPSEEQPVEQAGGELAVVANGPVSQGGAIHNREEAFRILLQLAEYFRRNEPHTPVSYALEQAVRWGRMPLPELLTELIPDEGPRRQFFKQVGISSTEG